MRVLILLLTILSVLGKWDGPVELFNNTQSLTACLGLVIDPATGVRHVVYHSWHLDKVFYQQVDPSGKVLRRTTFEDKVMRLASDGFVTASEDAKRIYVMMNGQRSALPSKRDIWYTESLDGGATWMPVVKMNNNDDDNNREAGALVVVHETGRVYGFYTLAESSGMLSQKSTLIMVTKPAGSSVFGNEVSILERPPGLGIRNTLTAQYTIKNGSPVLHLMWAEQDIYTMHSKDNGITWSDPMTVSEGDMIYPYSLLESASNRAISPVFAGLYLEYTTKKRRIALTKDHGETFTLVDATAPTRVRPDSFAHTSGIVMCGSKENPQLFVLMDMDQDQLTYTLVDLNTLDTSKADPPFLEHGADVSGIVLACATDMEHGKIMLSAVTEVGYGQPLRRLLMDSQTVPIKKALIEQL